MERACCFSGLVYIFEYRMNWSNCFHSALTNDRLISMNLHIYMCWQWHKIMEGFKRLLNRSHTVIQINNIGLPCRLWIQTYFSLTRLLALQIYGKFYWKYGQITILWNLCFEAVASMECAERRVKNGFGSVEWEIWAQSLDDSCHPVTFYLGNYSAVCGIKCGNHSMW